MSQIPTSISTEFVLDTNVAIEFLNTPELARAKIGSAAILLVPSIVFGELYRGARKSSRLNDNLKRIKSFSESVTVLNADLETANEYGMIQQSLREKGKPIPQNDVWIAAMAIQAALPLVTRDKHFQHVDGLHIVDW